MIFGGLIKVGDRVSIEPTESKYFRIEGTVEHLPESLWDCWVILDDNGVLVFVKDFISIRKK